MKTVSITATAEGTGKTGIALALGRIAQDRGRAVGYMKPKGTRLEGGVGAVRDRDPAFARELLGLESATDDVEPIVYSPTFVEGAVRGQEDVAALHRRVEAAFDTLSTGRDLMLVEGADTLVTGGIIDMTDRDIATSLDAEVVLVAGFEQFSDLDDLLGAIDAIGDRFAGVLFNGVDSTARDRLEQDAIPFLEQRGYPTLGVLPHERELAGVTVAELAAELGAQQLTEVDSEAFVERFVVGAMSGDEALRYFRRTRNAAVITGGDRSEIHTAAIEAPGVTCLVVTGGHRPSSSVLGKARQAGLSVIAVTGDTLTAVERAEGVVRSGRVRDAETVRQMRGLLEEHADVDAILQ